MAAARSVPAARHAARRHVYAGEPTLRARVPSYLAKRRTGALALMHSSDTTPREISNVALLDLTGAAAETALTGVTRISEVAAILVPESLLPKLSSIPMERVAATVPIPDGQRVRVFTGQIVLSGDALAAPADGTQESLVVTG